MKFQDDISNMNTYIHTYGQAETNMPPHFFKVGGIIKIKYANIFFVFAVVLLKLCNNSDQT